VVIRPKLISTRLRLICGGLPVLVAVAALAASPSAAATRETLKSPLLADLGIAAAPIPDSILSTRATRSLQAAASWGGTFTASTGEQVSIHVSDSYPVDNARAQRWADFLASLVHGTEISSVQVYLAPLDEVQQYCGQDALACYSPNNDLLVAPGDDPSSDLSAEAVVTHEYGHHVANSRNDAPWQAIDYGTKRWASYMQVCSKTQAGQLFPGAESDSRYRLNPGEGFAESYRVLNQRRLGIQESPWQVVSQSLYPDENALNAIQQDVVTPWTGPATSTVSAPLTKRAKTRTLSIATPLDGTFRVTIRAAKGERLGVNLVTSSGARVGHTVVTGGSARTLTTTVCGSRTYGVQLNLAKGAGRARAVISKA
jgi:hypothetical protein